MVVVHIRKKGVLTIPSELRTQLGLEEGDAVDMEIDDGRLIVTPVRVVPRDQAWFWTPEWQADERQADKEIAAGQGTVYHSAEEFFGALEASMKPEED